MVPKVRKMLDSIDARHRFASPEPKFKLPEIRRKKNQEFDKYIDKQINKSKGRNKRNPKTVDYT